MLPNTSWQTALFSFAAQAANSGRTGIKFPPTASFSLGQLSDFGQPGSLGRTRRRTFGESAHGAAAHDGIADACTATAAAPFSRSLRWIFRMCLGLILRSAFAKATADKLRMRPLSERGAHYKSFVVSLSKHERILTA